MHYGHRSNVTLATFAAIAGLVGTCAAVFAQTGGGPHQCQFCYQYSAQVQICDTITCPAEASCSGEICQANSGLVVRACCNACPDDDWQDTCADPQ